MNEVQEFSVLVAAFFLLNVILTPSLLHQLPPPVFQSLHDSSKILSYKDLQPPWESTTTVTKLTKHLIYCLFLLKICLAPFFCLPPCHNNHFPKEWNLGSQTNCAFKYPQIWQTEVQETSVFSSSLTAGIYAAPSIEYTEILKVWKSLIKKLMRQ